MLKVNLASKKQAGFTQGGGKPFGLDNVNVNVDDIKDFPLLRIFIVLGIYFGGNYFVDAHKEATLNQIQGQIRTVNTQIDALNLKLRKKKGYEREKAQLEKDEFTMKSKINTIETLMKGKEDTIILLRQVSSNLPGNVWIRDIEVRGDDVVVKGTALTFQDITAFVRNLSESAFFSEISMGDSVKDTEQKYKVEVVKFDIKATRRRGILDE